MQYCGNYANIGGVAGCTVTNPAGPFPGTVYVNGNPLPRARKWQGNFALTYSVPFRDGVCYATTDWDYRSSYNMFLYEAREYKAKPLVEGGLHAGCKWDNGKYELAAYSRNITNRIQVIAAIDFDYRSTRRRSGLASERRSFGLPNTRRISSVDKPSSLSISPPCPIPISEIRWSTASTKNCMGRLVRRHIRRCRCVFLIILY